MALQFDGTCNSEAGILFWHDVIFWVPKTSAQVHILHIKDQHFTRRTWPHRHKTSGFPQENSNSNVYPLPWEHSLIL
jgi:hypothetical protein